MPPSRAKVEFVIPNPGPITREPGVLRQELGRIGSTSGAPQTTARAVVPAAWKNRLWLECGVDLDLRHARPCRNAPDRDGQSGEQLNLIN